MRRFGDPVTIGDRLLVGALIAAAAVVVALDAVTAVRLLVFESAPPAIHQTEAAIREVAATKGRRGSVPGVFVATNDGWMPLHAGPATVLGTPRTGVGSKRVLQNVLATVTWIDAPASAFGEPIHYPVHIEQSGRVLIDVDGAAGIVRIELRDLAVEAGLCGAFLAALVWFLVAMNRRDKVKMAAARAAWRRLHRE